MIVKTTGLQLQRVLTSQRESECDNPMSVPNTHQFRQDQLISLNKVSHRSSPLRLIESRQFSQQMSQCYLTTNKQKQRKKESI